MIKEAINFAKEMYPLMVLIRYNTVPKIVNETVASHSHQVSLIALKMYEECKDYMFSGNKQTIDLKKILVLCTIHDIAEAKYGDIEYTTKKNVKGLKTLMDSAEKEYIKQVLGDEYLNLFIDYENLQSPEAVIVKLADTISCHVYVQKELELGNTQMKRVLKETEDRIKVLEKEFEKWVFQR